jgi:hypothetical protein
MCALVLVTGAVAMAASLALDRRVEGAGVLAGWMAWAAALSALCRERLGAARIEVTRIVADLDLAAPTVGVDDEPVPADTDTEDEGDEGDEAHPG